MCLNTKTILFFPIRSFYLELGRYTSQNIPFCMYKYIHIKISLQTTDQLLASHSLNISCAITNITIFFGQRSLRIAIHSIH